MGLSTPWTFDQLNHVTAAQGSALATNRRTMRTLKDALKGVTGCTVVGSSDSAAGALDGVDRWDSDADLVWDNDLSPHSWIVLQFAGLANGQLMIALDSALFVGDPDPSNFNPSYAMVRLWWSPGGTFNGGDASTTPSVADAEPVSWPLTAEDGQDDKSTVVHVPYASNGSQWMAVVYRYVPSLGTGQSRAPSMMMGAMSFAHPRVALPAALFVAGAGDNNIDNPPLLSVWTAPSPLEMSVRTLLTWGGGGSGEAIRLGFSAPLPWGARRADFGIAGHYTCVPIAAEAQWDTEASDDRAGIVGAVPDLYFTSYGADTLALTDTSGARFVVIAGLAIPWGASELHIDDAGAVDMTEGVMDVWCGCGLGGSPTVTVVSPTPGVQPGQAGGFPAAWSLARVTPIVIDIDGGGLEYACVVARHPADQGHVERCVYRRGKLRPGFAVGSTVQQVTATKLRISVLPDEGWPSFAAIAAIEFDADAIAGGAISDLAASS